VAPKFLGNLCNPTHENLQLGYGRKSNTLYLNQGLLPRTPIRKKLDFDVVLFIYLFIFIIIKRHIGAYLQ